MIRLLHFPRDFQLRWQWYDDDLYLAGFGDEGRARAHGKQHGWIA